MNPSVEASGKNIEAAINNALFELKITREDVDINIISEGGFFKKAKVVLTVSDDAIAKYNKMHKIVENNETLNTSKNTALQKDLHNVKENKTISEKLFVEDLNNNAKKDATVTSDLKYKENTNVKTANYNVKSNENINKNFSVKSNEKFDENNNNKSDFLIKKDYSAKTNASFKKDDEKITMKKEELSKQFAKEVQEGDFEIVGTEFLNNLLSNLNITAKIEVLKNGEDIFFEINSDDEVNLLIGNRGETLNAVQFLLSTIVTRQSRSIGRVRLNINHYKEQRELNLTEMAVNKANSVLETGRTFKFEPMVSYERKIIHSVLQTMSGIKTHSEGEDPNRRLVITLAK